MRMITFGKHTSIGSWLLNFEGGFGSLPTSFHQWVLWVVRCRSRGSHSLELPGVSGLAGQQLFFGTCNRPGPGGLARFQCPSNCRVTVSSMPFPGYASCLLQEAVRGTFAWRENCWCISCYADNCVCFMPFTGCLDTTEWFFF